MKDNYKILGLADTASKRLIKKTFRAKAIELHLRMNKSVEVVQNFIELNEAHKVLVFGKNQYDILYNAYILKKEIEDPEKFKRKKQKEHSQAYK